MRHDAGSMILNAAQAAARWHAKQRRKGSACVPYINHLLEVARLVDQATGSKDPNLIVAALLHDAVEDQGVSRATIAEQFGEDVAALVEEVVLPHPRMFPAVLVIASIRCSIASLIQRQLPLSHFLSSAPCGGPSFVPAALPSRRRAQWRSRLAASLAATEGLALRATSTAARSKRYGARQVVSD
jgi:hypothetical protein